MGSVVGKKREALRWVPVAVLLVFALIAPLFGDSPTGVVIPLLLAVMLAGVNVTMPKKERSPHGAE
ncbi:hypothetical protein K7395_16665 [Streptomyces filamentosus]|uniref:Uncharacterized protein n=2 Tax=Streptomyces filamentosus TaxID=67294 RepID=A0ABY4UVA1_STRFL|nr:MULTISPECIES: hypothetical protein [Streptomyces]EFE76208.1 predicted protein [Streptomyces filamentosus NRRL 15998]ESU49437.1 hypothetical protein P376_2584 [Streptomyces sp. HCCB10043]EWS93197.1 hypothetical protein SSIG_03770 [Streptomyces filamentosus NRRL 11379]MYR80212.1 hypothetical protein [Streptomyces sp. SID5466]USC48256.1 hypothetical protein K7395_16665 [Streptomyces filamentosus]